MPTRTSAFLAAMIVLLTGCKTAFHDVGTPVSFTPPEKTIPMQSALISPEPIVYKESHRYEMEDNSLWNMQDAVYFRDTRAFRIGDILTVRIFINDSAKLNNRSVADAGTNGSLGVDLSGNLFERDLPGSSLSGSLDAEVETTKGGTVNRAERIQLHIAAAVIETAPNGNLLIQGTQEVRVNHQMRVLTVTGVVRSRDIEPDNSISYDKIAEARISYGGSNTRRAMHRAPKPFLAGLTVGRGTYGQ